MAWRALIGVARVDVLMEETFLAIGFSVVRIPEWAEWTWAERRERTWLCSGTDSDSHAGWHHTVTTASESSFDAPQIVSGDSNTTSVATLCSGRVTCKLFAYSQL